MKKSKIKEIAIIFGIVAFFIIILLIYGFSSNVKDSSKSPEFQKFVLSTNFPINDYIYKEDEQENPLIITKEEPKKEEVKTEEKKEKSIKEQVEQLKNEVIQTKNNYTSNIFPNQEKLEKEELEKKQKALYGNLTKNLPKIEVAQNNYKEPSTDELDFGDSKFSNQSNQNSVSSETKLYRTITADKRIPLLLTSSIISTLDGQVTGLVEEDIFAFMGTAKLIPKGSKAIGSYVNSSQLGENRFGLIWERIITPYGHNIILEESQSADIKGNSGVVGVIDDRYLERYFLPLALSTISNGLLLALSNETLNTSSQNNSNTQILLDNSRQDLSYIMKNIIDEQIKVKPIIKVQEASRVFIVPRYDIFFPEPTKGEILVKYYNKKGEIK